jgi:uncharacterized tellurite resistance protein B-like protein
LLFLRNGANTMKKSQLRRFTTVLIGIFILVGVMVLITETLEARAGSGHRYSGSRSRSYGGSSSRSYGSRSSRGYGSSSDGAALNALIHFVINYPLLGIPLLCLVAYGYYIIHFKADDFYVERTVRKAAPIQAKEKRKAVLAKLRQKDPGFQEVTFTIRARKAFQAIQKAWANRDLTKAQAFLSDGVYEQFSIQIEEMKEKGIIDFMSDLKVTETNPVHFHSDSNFDVIQVQFTASAINYRKDEKTGKKLDGSTSPEPFSEVWSFLRKPGAKTTNKPGLIEGSCPNCGNPLQAGRVVKCEVCNSYLRSGEYDWVLAEITQAMEYSTNDHKFIPGLNDMIKADPGYNVQHIEDRVSVMFWRKKEAERKGNISPLRKIAKYEYCNSLTEGFKPDNSGARRYYTNCAVGAVDILGIEQTDSFDKTYVTVTWSGFPCFMTAQGKEEISNQPINLKEVYVLARKSGANTNMSNSLSSSHCPSCGAPESSSLQDSCEYCGTVLNDGTQDWVLENIIPRNDPAVSEIIARVKSLKTSSVEPQVAAAPSGGSGNVPNVTDNIPGVSTGELLRWTVAMMLADGHIDPKEKETIMSLAKKHNIPDAKVEQVIAQMSALPDPVGYVLGENTSIGNELLEQLMRVALADGTVSSQETYMLCQIGSKIGLGAADVKMRTKQMRKKIYQEAKEALRRAKMS